MKIAFKNFLTTLRRYKTASLLNIAGLTMAFTAFYVILTQVWWEVGYNRSLPDAERIYLVESVDWFDPTEWSAWINRPIVERAIASAPDVEAGGCMWGSFGEGTCWTRDEINFGYKKFTAGSGSISLPLLDVFSFRSLMGDVHDLAKANSVIVSRRTAERLGVGIGDLLWVDSEQPKPGEEREIVAVFEDFPDNSLLKECGIVESMGEKHIQDFSQWSFNYFVRLRAGADPAVFAQQCMDIDRKIAEETREKTIAEGGTPDPDDDSQNFTGVRLVPLQELYFDTTGGAPGPQGSAVTTYSLLGIAVLVIALAFINFVNFFFALVPVRIRTVNTFKVFGAPTSSLRLSFVFETFGLVVLSLFAACYIGFALQGSEFASYVSAPLALSQNLPVAGLVIVVAFAAALAASLYPACYITSFTPAMVVKGAFSGMHGGRRLRTLLLGVQYFCSLGLIIATCFILLQHRYMMNYDMGFDKHNLLAVQNTRTAAEKYDALRSKLLADPRICGVTGASGKLVSKGHMGWGREFKGKPMNVQAYTVEWNFLREMGIRIVEGRDFLESDACKEKGALIFNDCTKREFGITLGDGLNGFSIGEPIVGFCADFNFKPLQYGVEPFAFYVIPQALRLKGYHLPTTVYVRMVPGTDAAAVAGEVRRAICELDPHAIPEEITIRNFDEELGEEYTQERRLAVIVGAFSLLAVVIALMGVFGIVLFETQHRRREIAVRRVMGASQGEILRMFNRRYVVLVCICFVLAAPVSGWAVRCWLMGFAYAVPMSWWVFAIALAAVLAVTILTVTVRTWRAANENPADCIKSE